MLSQRRSKVGHFPRFNTQVLRRGSEMQLDAKLQAGAAGDIKVKAESKYALRKAATGLRRR